MQDLSTEEILDNRYKVLRNRKVCEKHYLLDIEIPPSVGIDPKPGQFFMVVCDPDADARLAPPLTLRRPLSIHRIRYRRSDQLGTAEPPRSRQAATISFLYRVVGEGTELLSRIPPGGYIDALGPLGNGFAIGPERTAVIVSGGIGVAPLAALAEELRYQGKEVRVYFGAVRGEMLNLAISHREEPGVPDPALEDVIRSEFQGLGVEVLGVCTDDGSVGAKALVTELLEGGIRDGCVPKQDLMLYACGPHGMMRAVAEIASRNSLPCQVSLEERMACGVGACYVCTCRAVLPDGTIRKRRVCREGPVFFAKDIQWND